MGEHFNETAKKLYRRRINAMIEEIDSMYWLWSISQYVGLVTINRDQEPPEDFKIGDIISEMKSQKEAAYPNHRPK